MTLPQHFLAALALIAAACGGAVSGGSDGTGGGVNSGNSGGGGAGGGTGGSMVAGGSSGTGGTSGTGGMGGTTSVEAGSDARACGVIRASDYDQTCTADSDCAAVVEGNTCGCVCPTASISRKALGHYQPVFGPGPSCMCPNFGTPTCVAGACTMCGGVLALCADGGAAAYGGSSGSGGAGGGGGIVADASDAGDAGGTTSDVCPAELLANPFNFPGKCVPAACLSASIGGTVQCGNTTCPSDSWCMVTSPGTPYGAIDYRCTAAPVCPAKACDYPRFHVIDRRVECMGA